MKNPTRPDSSPIRVVHQNFDALDYHHPQRKERQKSAIKPITRDEFGRTNIPSADHPVVEEDEGITKALKKDLQNKGL